MSKRRQEKCQHCHHERWVHEHPLAADRTGRAHLVERFECSWQGCRCSKFAETELDALLEELIR